MGKPIPREDELIPSLHLLYGVLSNSLPDGLSPRLRRELEQLPYYLRGACAAVIQLEDARLNVRDHFAQLGLSAPAATPWILNGEQSLVLCLSVDFYFFCLRRALDALTYYLHGFQQQFNWPDNFPSVLHGIKKKKSWNLDPKILEITTAYWELVGEKINKYRNTGTHALIVPSDCYMFITPTGEAKLRMLLPHIPEDRQSMNYDPGVPAMSFLLDSLVTTTQYINQVVNRIVTLKMPPNGRPSAMMFAFSGRGGPIRIGPGVEHIGEPIPYLFDLTKIALGGH